MEASGHEKRDYWWYLDLRAMAEQSMRGFGLGFEGSLCILLAVSNIRDVLPHPGT
jgi:asparaginyl-tRNA synthetase